MSALSFPIADAGDVDRWFTLSDLKNSPFILLAPAAMVLGAVAFFIFWKK